MMPILSYFAIVGSALVALLFAADVTLPKSAAPVIATSSIYGMPKPWRPDPTQTLAATPAPAPDMSSEAVLAAAPKTEPVNGRSVTADAAHTTKNNCRQVTMDKGGDYLFVVKGNQPHALAKAEQLLPGALPPSGSDDR